MASDAGQDAQHVSASQAFGQVLAELRRDRGLSQERLALEAGYHRTYVSLLERGKYSPSLDAIVHLARVLGISPSDLVHHAEVRMSPEVRQPQRRN